MNNTTEQGQGQTALVTGGANGIGWAICQALAAQGYRVAIADLDLAAAQERAQTLGSDHLALGVDLTDANAASALPGQAAQALGRLDLVVNNAGMTDTTGKSIATLPEDRFDRLVALNLTAVQVICDAAAPLLPRGGAIINLASGAAWRPLALRGPYSATKSAVVALTEGLAQDLAPKGIAVSAVAPGYTRTPLLQSLHDEGRVDLVAIARGIPLGRLVEPEDIAGAVAFLTSPAGHRLSGETLSVDAGSQLAQGPLPDPAIAPAAGTTPGDAVVVLSEAGDTALRDALNAGADPEDTTGLAHVIDTRLSTADPAQALRLARDTARRCAALQARSPGFALTFVLTRGTGQPAGTASRAAEAAVAMLGRTLALEWAAAGMRVNTVLTQATPDAATDAADLAALCRYVGSDAAAALTGQLIRAIGT